MSTYTEYTVEQGATFKAQLQIRTDTNDGMNLVPYLLTGQIRKSHYSLNTSANITCTFIDSANGSVQLSIPYQTTANIKAGRYVFDVEAAGISNGEVVRLIEGMITVTPEVTRT